jgi:hypothetical protein
LLGRAINMVAYIGVAPLASALAAKLPRKTVMASGYCPGTGGGGPPCVGEAGQVEAR